MTEPAPETAVPLRKSILVPIGIFLTLAGIITPLPLMRTDDWEDLQRWPSAVTTAPGWCVWLAITGVVCVIVGILKAHKHQERFISPQKLAASAYEDTFDDKITNSLPGKKSNLLFWGVVLLVIGIAGPWVFGAHFFLVGSLAGEVLAAKIQIVYASLTFVLSLCKYVGFSFLMIVVLFPKQKSTLPNSNGGPHLFRGTSLEGRWCSHVALSVLSVIPSGILLMIGWRLLGGGKPAWVRDNSSFLAAIWIAAGIVGLLYGLRAFRLARMNRDERTMGKAIIAIILSVSAIMFLGVGSMPSH
ncbi:MAG TPA: hypothetical protein PKA41_05985 [Verrucomicrobiota bacterium]|nr:hypothetical protein [Verrucomicrobiota bacterium]